MDRSTTSERYTAERQLSRDKEFQSPQQVRFMRGALNLRMTDTNAKGGALETHRPNEDCLWRSGGIYFG
jgi:hypothetical protein